MHKLIKYAFASALVIASSSASFALNFTFSFTNTIGNTAGTITGEVIGLKDNAVTNPATDVIITSYPSVMTGMPPAPFSLMTGSHYISRSMNNFPVYNGQVQTDGNLGHGLFEFDSIAMYDYNWDFCISGIGYATSPCMPPSWLSSGNQDYTNFRHVMTNDIAQFTPLLGGPSPVRASHDFDGDRKSDILWRDTSGNVAIWIMNGARVSSAGLVGSVPISVGSNFNFSIVGQRDFDGDGKSDILWRDSNTGAVAIWFMNGPTVLSGPSIGSVPTNWSVVGTGDFDGDGKGDILWRDTSGNVAIWFMNGATILSGALVGNIPTNWSVVGTGDFDGDGRSDLLWRDSAGNVAVWLMNGSVVSSAISLGNIPTSWAVVGTGDFNGDGVADMLWRDSSGNIAVWFMGDNGTVVSGASLGNVPSSWSIAETGDFDGDGKGDILWRNNYTGGTGDVAIWFMNGGAVASAASLGNVPTTWTIQGLNAD